MDKLNKQQLELLSFIVNRYEAAIRDDKLYPLDIYEQAIGRVTELHEIIHRAHIEKDLKD